MKAVIEYLVTLVVMAFVKALSQPGVAAGLIGPIIDAMHRHQVNPATHNQDDEDFKDAAARDGWDVS